ncbi:MAG: class I SAM-dependent methyltransferase [Candidatus Latescibacteria bacterium]|jgi:ubiquinone/menaquinone biosynthesis C-methylase UbiE|nr:class I SAM-dependent methyltransferase [Candidatus Latescibacterota bacterium]
MVRGQSNDLPDTAGSTEIFAFNQEIENPIIPFYGSTDSRLFAIERRCMDRDGKVIATLNQLLPQGRILDVGAGSGFTAVRLRNRQRSVIPLEPSRGMIDRRRNLPWVRGMAQTLPFKDSSFDGAYATWAYFFPGFGYGEAGLKEVDRIVHSKGTELFVDNAGDDDFCALFQQNIASDSKWWVNQGFSVQYLETSFRFDNLEESERLISSYWSGNGRAPGSRIALEYSFRVAIYHRKRSS